MIEIVAYSMGLITGWCFYEFFGRRISIKKGELYKVYDTRNGTYLIGAKYRTFITVMEEGSIIPLSCTEEVYQLVSHMIYKNPSKDIYIKAVIDRKKLSILEIKGYQIKEAGV